MTGAVSISRLPGHASQVIREVAETGKVTFVTRRGQPVAVIAPVGSDRADDLPDHVLANTPEYVASMHQASMHQADEDLAAGRTNSLADAMTDMDG